MIEIPASDLNPGQLKGLKSRSPFLLFAGGYGAGKSVWLILKLLQLKSINGDLPGLLIAQSFAALWTNIVDPMLAMLERSVPPRLVPRIYGGRNSGKAYLQFADGGVVHLRSAECIGGYEGVNAAWLCGDELRLWSKKAYDVAIARVRIKRSKLPQKAFASTPEMHWMADEFNSGVEDRELLSAPTTENEHNLIDGYVSGLKGSYSERMQRAVLKGEFTILEGAVYEQFDPNHKTSPWIEDFDPKTDLNGCRVHLAVDPGYRRSSWIWIAERGPLDWVAFDELMPDNTTDTECVRQVNAKKYPIDEIWVDPAADNTQSFAGLDTLTALRAVNTRSRGPIRSVTKLRNIPFGVDKLRVLLGGTEEQPIRLKIARQLFNAKNQTNRGVVKDIGAYRYPEVKDGKAVGDMPLKDGKTDHTCDAMRYWAVGRWMVVPQLRNADPVLRSLSGQGYQIAA